MTSKSTSIHEYLSELPDSRIEPMTKLHNLTLKSLPTGFEACMNYGMIGYVVPHKLYPSGYHCDPKLPLPFIAIASQKQNISLYHMGIYADPDLLEWFTASYQSLNIGKLDMGKSCIRLKNMDKIPYDLWSELCQKMTVQDWIEKYERELKR